jgi:hypothetical protein
MQEDPSTHEPAATIKAMRRPVVLMRLQCQESPLENVKPPDFLSFMPGTKKAAPSSGAASGNQIIQRLLLL